MSRTSRTVTITGPREGPHVHAARVRDVVAWLTMIGLGVSTCVYQRSHGEEWVTTIFFSVVMFIVGCFPGLILGGIAYPFAWTYFRLFGDVQVRAEQFTDDEDDEPYRPAVEYEPPTRQVSFVVVRRINRD